MTSIDNVSTLPMDNYQDVAHVLCRVDASHGPVKISNLVLIGCIGEGMYPAKHGLVYFNS